MSPPSPPERKASLNPEALAAPLRSPDPLARVQALDNDTTRTGAALGVFTAFLVHGAAVLISVAIPPDEIGIDAAIQTLVVDITPEEPAAPPPPPEPPPPEIPPLPEPPPPVIKPPEPEEDPYEDIDTKPAEATKVLTAPSEPDDPPAPRDQTFVTGEGTGFGNGMVSAQGEGNTATYNPRAHVANTVKGPLPDPKPPPQQQAPVKDRSRPAGLLLMSMCERPEGVDGANAVAQVVVTVAPNGRAIDVQVVHDPGHGLGRIAKACAFAQTYSPGRDAWGRPVTTKTPPIRVRFDR